MQFIYLGTNAFEKSRVQNKKKGEKIMMKKTGFTLAEVLITLGIIGVVAAMTMPTLINQTNGAQYKAAYKKALSAISQGVTLNVALDDISFADNGAANILPGRMNVVNNTTTRNYPITGTNAPEGNGTTSNTSLFFNDSSMFEFITADVECKLESPCYGFIDVNGSKGPNKMVESADNPTDVYPVVYYDQTILPHSETARQVLYNK